MMRKLTLLFVSFLAVVGIGLGFVTQASAAPYVVKCPPGYTPIKDNPNDSKSDKHSCCPNNVKTKTAMNCLIGKYVDPAIQLLSIVVGVAVVIGITMGAIQYASSAGDPQKASAGKSKILKAMYALVAFFFLYSALQFLSPGGLSPKTYPPGQANAKLCAAGNDFLTLKPWYAYLPPTAGVDENGKTLYTFGTTCQVDNFRLLPETVNGKTNPSMVPSILLVIADDLVRIIGLVAVAYVIIGGIQYVTSQGEPDRTKHAQETVLNALIGLVVAIVAASFVAYIGTRIST